MNKSEISNGHKWYVIHTKPKQESRAESNLRAWGLQTLLPKLRERRLAKASMEASYREAPLFPGYLFARFDVASQLRAVRLTRGVHCVVGFGDCAAPVDDSVMQALYDRIRTDGFVRLAEPKPGDRIKVISGPLRSLEGVFERTASGRDRVFILLTTVGALVRVEIPRELIRKASVLT